MTDASYQGSLQAYDLTGAVAATEFAKLLATRLNLPE